MNTHCPHCSQHLEIDQETMDLLQNEPHFECPSCGGQVPVASLARKRPIAPLQSAGMAGLKTSADGGSRKTNQSIVRTFLELNRNLRILGGVALLVLGGLAVFLASRNTGNTVSERVRIHNQIIHNDYFTNLIASGATNEKELEAVKGLLACGPGFIGVSKEKLNWQQALELAKRTGAEILNIAAAGSESRQQVTRHLTAAFPQFLGKTVWVMEQGAAKVIDSPDVLNVTTLDRPRPVFLHWPPRTPTVDATDVFALAAEPPPVIPLAGALPASFGGELRLRPKLTGSDSGLRFDAQGNPVVTLQPAVNTDPDLATLLTPRGGIVALAAKDGKVRWAVPHADLEAMGGYTDCAQCRVGYEFDDAGDLAFIGESYTPRGRDVLIAKIGGGDGKVLWRQRFNRSATGDDLIVEHANGWTTDAAGNIIVSIQSGGPGVAGPGITVSPSSPAESFSTSAFLFDGKSGRQLWERRAMASGFYLNGFAFFRGNGTLLCILNAVLGNTSKLMVLDQATGNLQWETPQDFPNPVLPRADGVLCGSEFYDHAGKRQWAFELAKLKQPAPAKAPWQDLIATPKGDYWMVRDASLVCHRFDGTTGRMLCESQPLEGLDEEPSAAGKVTLIQAAADVQGDCLVSWINRNEPKLAKISGNDGTILWQKSVGHLAERDSGEASRIDPDGNVLWVFREQNQESSRVIKYANATGAVLWDRPLPLGHRKFEMDAAGNLWIIDREMKTLLKINGSIGTIEWIVTFAK